MFSFESLRPINEPIFDIKNLCHRHVQLLEHEHLHGGALMRVEYV